MKPSELDLPPEISGFVTRAGEWLDPPGATRERLRGRLGWAFQGNDDEAAMRSRRPGPMAVPQRQPNRRRWPGFLIARAAAAMLLAHIPLALAGLGVVGVAIPVTQLVLGRHVRSRAPMDPPAQLPPQTPQPLLPATHPRAAPVPVVPALPPPPAEFDATKVAPPPLPRPVPSAVVHPAPSALPARPPDDDVALSVERGLLDQARLALVRDDPSSALARLTEHEARYPDSQLAEVREALAIQALLRAGRVADARFRDDAFRRRFPTSLLQPALDAAFHE